MYEEKHKWLFSQKFVFLNLMLWVFCDLISSRQKFHPTLLKFLQNIYFWKNN